jgi:hypothetical protein
VNVSFSLPLPAGVLSGARTSSTPLYAEPESEGDEIKVPRARGRRGMSYAGFRSGGRMDTETVQLTLKEEIKKSLDLVRSLRDEARLQ